MDEVFVGPLQEENKQIFNAKHLHGAYYIPLVHNTTAGGDKGRAGFLGHVTFSNPSVSLDSHTGS